MNETTILLLCLAAIVISIAICFKTGINMGLIAMTFAFLIGCLFMGEKAASIFGFWPDSLIFFLLASAMFYGFARENGTLTLFGTKLLYKFRKSIEALPFVFAFIAFVLGLLGAGPGTIVLLAPLGFSVCAQTGIDPLLMVFAIDTGYNCGTQNPWTGTGVVLYGLVEESGVAADIAIHTYMLSYTTFLINKVLFLVLFYVGFKFLKGKKNAGTQKVQNLDILEKEPEQFSKIQKKTMILILVSFCLLVIPNIINTLVKIKDPAFKNLVALCKPQAVLIIFALIASFMKLAIRAKIMSTAWGLQRATRFLNAGSLIFTRVLIIFGITNRQKETRIKIMVFFCILENCSGSFSRISRFCTFWVPAFFFPFRNLNPT